MSKVDLRLDWCSHEAAKYAVEHWHYSKSMPTPPVVKIGVWESGNFIGCVLFSRGATTNYGKAYRINTTQVCELTRVALNNHKSPVSRILSIAIKMLRAKEKGLRLIISFADANHGHLGKIYQATNWVYTGQTSASSKFSDSLGRIWHGRQVSRTGVKRQYGEYRRVPKIEDCHRIRELPKHRYLMPLDDAMRAQIEPLRKPYPKRETRGRGETDSAAESNPQTGGASPTRPLTELAA